MYFMAIHISVELTCDVPHPWDPPTNTVPPDTEVRHYLSQWMLRNGWSIDATGPERPRMLCPACTYNRLVSEGYDAVFF